MKVFLTPDNQWLLIIALSKARITASASGYEEITDSDSFYTGDMTDDHEFLFLGQDSGEVSIYRYNGLQYIFL